MRMPKDDGSFRVPILDRIPQLRSKLLQKSLGLPALSGSETLLDLGTIAKLLDCSMKDFAQIHGRPSAAFVAIEVLANEIGVMNFCDFRDAGGLADDMFVAKYAECPVRSAAKAFRQFLIDNDLKVPASVKANGTIGRTLIAREMGVPFGSISYLKAPGRQAVNAIAEELGLMDAAEYLERRSKISPPLATEGLQTTWSGELGSDIELAKMSKLLSHLKVQHVDTSLPLPASDRNCSLPAYRSVCLSAGLPFKGLGAEQDFCNAIDAVALIVGIGPARLKPFIPIYKTFSDLIAAGTLYFQIIHGTAEPKNLGRFLWAMNTFMKASAVTKMCDIGDAMGVFFAEKVATCSELIANKNTRKQFTSGMREWQRVYKLSMIVESGLPDTFAGALVLLFKQSGFKSVRALCRAGKVEHMQREVQNWCKNLTAPALGDETVISALERALAVVPGTLLNRLAPNSDIGANFNIPIAKRPTALRSNTKLWNLVRPLLPANFMHLPTSERERIGDSYYREFKITSPYRERIRLRTRWRLVNLPKLLDVEWGELVQYKTAIVPLFPRLTVWRPGTVDRNKNIMLHFFSVLALPKVKGGLAIPHEEMCLAMLGVPTLVQHYFNWLMERSPEGLDTGTRTTLGYLGNLTASEAGSKGGRQSNDNASGYLHYKPDLAHSLVPIAGVLTDEDIAKMRTVDGWVAALTQTNDFVRSVFRATEDSWVFSRDPFAEIMPILEMPRPLDALIMLLNKLHLALPSNRLVTPLTRAHAVRRFIGTLILVRTALRTKNIRNLTFNTNGTGQIRKSNGVWIIEIPAKEFKNSSGPYFKLNKARGAATSSYFFQFPEEDTAILDEYATISRVVLHQNSPISAYFLVAERGKKLHQSVISSDMRNHTWQYLVYHEETKTGIKGVVCFGAHAVRAITATHILKVSGDLALAASAIQDGVDAVISHYAQFASVHKQVLVSQFYAQDLSSPYH